MIKAYWYKGKEPNVGDTLTPFIVEHFLPGQKVEYVDGHASGKLLAVGSIMRLLTQGDVVWGTGIMRENDEFHQAFQGKFLAVRGKLSWKILKKYTPHVPRVFGDPALLLPLMYAPFIQKTHKIGVIPHYVDKVEFIKGQEKMPEDTKLIDVGLPWKEFVDEVLSCEYIISSSLHGIIIAEAYGIPAEWAVWSDKVLGNGFKFRDYLTGTGRQPQNPGKFPPISNLSHIQHKLIKSLQDYYQ